MTQSDQQALRRNNGQRPSQTSAWRTISALMLREMSTTYGRSALGYLWAIMEPVAGIVLLTFVFSLAFAEPPLGSNFPLFYASGMLPFLSYMDISQKVSQSLRFSRQLLFYPGVTYIDAMVARLVLNAMTQFIITVLVITVILVTFDVDIILNTEALFLAFLMLVALSAGVGTMNCYLLTAFPIWERAWAILNRPLFIISCVFFLFEGVPKPYGDFLWWNPIVHVIGQTRAGIYATYDAAYVSPIYIFLLSLILTAAGLLLLKRYHSDILDS